MSTSPQPDDQAKDQPKLSKTQQLVILWHQMAGQRLRYVGAMVCLALAAGIGLMGPLVVQLAVDGVIAETKPLPVWMAAWSNGWQLAAIGVVSLALTTIAGVFLFFRGRWVAIASEAICLRLRRRLYDRLQRAPMAWHADAEPGDTVQRCSSDVETIRAFLANQVVEVCHAATNLLIAVPILFWLDGRLAIASTVLMPLFILWGLFFFRWIHGTFKTMDQAEGKLTARIQENLTNIRVVRAFNRRDHEQDLFDGMNAEYTRRYWRHYVALSIYWSVSDWMVFSQMGLALFYGAYLVTLGPEAGIGVGTLIAAWLYVGMVVWPVRMMGRTLSELGKAMVSIERVEEILALPVEPPEGVELSTPVQGRIVFDGVAYGYGKEKHALDGASFTVEPGETVGIVGPSGSGKSTLVHLLMRFDEPTRGRILVDGQDIQTLTRASLRQAVGSVLQEPFLYAKSISENLRVGKADAHDAAITEAAQLASVDDAIQGFDRGYDTLVGERGVTLSGGQRQRMAIARAVLQSRPILVLDDAFSAVDTQTEAAIIQAIAARKGKATTLLIAHRLSTLQRADRILVLEEGKVTAQGTHDELITRPGLYQTLWDIQTQRVRDARGTRSDQNAQDDSKQPSPVEAT